MPMGVELRFPAQGLALGSGHSMSVSFDGAQHALVDLGDGRYRASLGAPTSVGVHPIEVLFDGQPSGAQVGLVAAGAPEFTTSYLLVDSPFELIAQAPHRYKFEVQPRDAEGRALGPGTQLVVSAVPDAFGAPVSVLDLPAPSGRRDGSFFFVLEREASLAGTDRKLTGGFTTRLFPGRCNHERELHQLGAHRKRSLDIRTALPFFACN